MKEPKPSEALVASVSDTIQGLDMGSLRQSLKAWKPTTKAEAVRMLHFISDMLAAEKEIKPRCYDRLDDKAADIEYEADGLKVRRVDTETKQYNESEEVIALQAEMEELKEKLQSAKDRAGFELVAGNHYWKALR